MRLGAHTRQIECDDTPAELSAERLRKAEPVTPLPGQATQQEPLLGKGRHLRLVRYRMVGRGHQGGTMRSETGQGWMMFVPTFV